MIRLRLLRFLFAVDLTPLVLSTFPAAFCIRSCKWNFSLAGISTPSFCNCLTLE
jgi:hypothetical protein